MVGAITINLILCKYYAPYVPGADPRGGQRGQLTPPPESYQGSQKNDVRV